MMEWTLPAVALLAPILGIGAYYGYRRTFMCELVTACALIFLLVAFDKLNELFLHLIRLVSGFLTKLLVALGIHGANLRDMIDGMPQTLLRIAFLIISLYAAYWMGGYLRSPSEERLSRFLGALIGAGNILFVLAIVGQRAVDILGPRRVHNLLLFPGSERGLSIKVPPLPEPSMLSQWSYYVALAVIVLLFVWGLSRLSRFRG
ncbi:hypothetical protein Tter_1606 [Thermobaculum terrenum ATCC BAA-798]|uniref:Uncharacterized protein n=1 Tax=Thermobaculum terrenum (strain ATCC BAA-798 / CCMEE 7001 / YNP1) TaxID=525904 RepID=D1CCJ7_THET1|nr:hypothetical protein [Thermobaculum terrenum]ACZ42512.1 hypothetical protein Tter_1606 [Thermobaculum terrenum ATCC BAA-798]